VYNAAGNPENDQAFQCLTGQLPIWPFLFSNCSP